MKVEPIMRSRAKAMRHEQTPAEAKLWQKLRAHRLMGLGFRRQFPIKNYIVDFACVEHKLIVELDGPSHTHDDQSEYDEKRTAFLESQSWQVLRIRNSDIHNEISAVCDRILATLNEKGVTFQ
jgi:very-short-patch-repair endonuclease